MAKGVILVDFDNVFYGHETSASYVKTQLEDFVKACLEASPDVDKLSIRLYGGWKMNAQYTTQASQVLGIIETVKSEMFPRFPNSRRVDGDLELAVSQYNLEIEWENTMQEKSARHFLKCNDDIHRICHHKVDECPVQMVAKATRGHNVVCPIDGCQTIDVSQLVRMEQKMVDSMMTCDILEFTHDDDCRAVVVVSDDCDLHPALALAGEKYAAAMDVNLVLMVQNKKNSEQFERLLGAHHISIRTWQ